MSEPVIVVEQSFGALDIETEAAARHGVRIVGSQAKTSAELLADAKGAAGLIVRFLKVDGPMLDEARWRVIGRYGIGTDNVDLGRASALGTAVINVPDYCIEEVAEHAVAMIYAGWRKLHLANQLVAADRWANWQAIGPVGRMSGATLGLIGGGRIGAYVARLLAPAFGRVLIHDPFAKAAPEGATLASLHEVLTASDVVSLHCPLTPATRNLLNTEQLGRMKPGSLLVNVSRGELIDVPALASALDAGRPGLAMLDVLPSEPPKADEPILHHPRAFVTPHVAWLSDAALVDLRAKVADRAAGYLVGKPGVSIVNALALGLGA